ncbi:MAG: asparagine synthetase B, partial [Candidatus Binatia bacterium]
MCGIAGFAGVHDRRFLEAMTDALIHRGPDDEGFYVDEQVSLGMRRLSIIDLQGGHALARPVVATSIDGVTEVA